MIYLISEKYTKIRLQNQEFKYLRLIEFFMIYLNKLFKLFKVSEFKSCLQENANALIAPTIFTNVPLNSQLNLNEVIV